MVKFRLILLNLVLIIFLFVMLPVAGTADVLEKVEIKTICMEHITFTKDPSEAVVVTWRSSEENADSYVEYWPAKSDGELNKAVPDYHSYRYARDIVHMYDALLGNLKPDTLYNYKIHCAEEESPVYSFYSGIKPGEKSPFTFVVMGDSRGGYETFAKCMRLARDAGARFILFTGDMTNGANQMEWDYWFSFAADTLPDLPLMPLHGNHEVLSRTYFEEFVLPDDERSYSFDYGMTHWTIALDSSSELLDESRAFVVKDLATERAIDADWKFLCTHKPFHSSSPDFNPMESPREMLEDVIEEGGVDMHFCGHVHTYERTHPLINGKRDDNGIVYQITGGAGAPLYPAPESPAEYDANYIATEHMIIYQITPDALKATVKTPNGSVIDEYVVQPRK